MGKFITIIDTCGCRISIRKDRIDMVVDGLDEFGDKNLFLMSNNNKIEISKECTFEQILNQLEDENN